MRFHSAPILFYFATLIFFSLPCKADYDFTKITKEETNHIIDSLLHDPLREIMLDYEGDSCLHRQSVSIPGSPLIYYRYYYPTGKLLREGLTYPSRDRVGTWKYYDEQGKFYKEFDFSSGKRTLYGMEKEKFDWLFDSLKALTKKFLVAHFGKKFVDEHIRIDPYMPWNSTREFESYGTAWPDMPHAIPDDYMETFSYIVYNDTIISETLSMDFDENFKMWEFNDMDDISNYHPDLKMDYNHAKAVAKKNGFNGDVSLIWDEQKNRYYWKTDSVLFHSETINTTHDSIREISIDATTGRKRIRILCYNMEENIDGYFSDFNKSCNDTVKIPAGWKKETIGAIIFNLPQDWIKTDLYKGYEHTYTFSNGKDSIRIESRSFISIESDPIPEVENARQEIHYLPNGKDSVVTIKPEPVYPIADTASINKFMSAYPEKTIQGREMKIGIWLQKDGTYNMKLVIYDSGVGMLGESPNDSFIANHVTAKQRDLILAVYKSIHFSTN